jgi:ribonucleoside-diphosphate reductase alpha chain
VADEAFKASGRDGLGTMHWVQVTSIIEDEEEVYDISVPEHRSFIGNGVVCHNTVNMNHDASIGDVAKAYERAFDKGCKCVAIYRDDSKKSQPLNTGTNKGKTKGKKATERSLEKVSFDESIETYLNTPEGLQEALRRVVKNPELAAMVPPTRREPSFHTSVGDRFHFTLPYQGETISVFIRFNCWQNTNDIMEVFIDLGKEGDTISGLIDSMARIISLGLQFGIPPKTIGHMLEGMNFGPNGFLGRSSVFGIRSVKSVPDLVGKLLQILPEYYAMGRPAAMLQPKPFSLDDPAPKYEPVSMAGNIATRNGKQEKAANLVEFPKSEKASVPTPTFVVKTQVRLKDEREITTSQEARARGFTGSTCKKCGSLRTVGTRSCFQCLDCGEYNGPCGG